MCKKICSVLLVFAILLTLFVGWGSADTAIVNLFDTATMIEGYYTGTGDRGPDNQYRSSAPIAVSKGDVITFGAALTEQGFQLVTMSDETTYTGQYRLADGVSVLHQIDETYSIMQFTVPENVRFIRAIAITENAERYLVTKNRPFTVEEMNNYFSTSNPLALVNLFDTATMIDGYYTGAGARNEDNQYRSSAPIPVEAGDVLTFGTALTEQGFHLVTMSDENTYNGQYRLAEGVSMLYDIDGTYSIMQFTVPQNVKFIRLIAMTEKANHYLATKNRPFNVTELNSYFNCDYVNLFDLATAKPGWVNGEGKVSDDDQYRVSPAIPVSVGDVITLAGAFTKQGFHLATIKEDNTYEADYTLGSGLTKTEDIDDNTSIMTFTVPTGIAAIRVIGYTQYINTYLVTKNHLVTKVGYNKYFFGNKTALFLGDSISYGAADAGRSWAWRMSNSLGFKPDNQSVNGWAISTSRQLRIINELKGVKYNSYDYVIMEGGTNDAWDSCEVGVVSDSYDPKDFDITTFAGGLEELFYNAYQRFPGARFGFIITYKMPLATDKGNVAYMEPIANISIDICKKWNVAYLDLYHDDYVNNTLLEVDTLNYLIDTVHPSVAAYDRLSPYIEQWFKQLTVNDISAFADKMPPIENCVPHAPYKVKNSLMVHDGESNYGWEPAANSTTTLNTQIKTQGNSSVQIYGKTPTANANEVGAMAFLHFDTPQDLSGYDTVLYDVYFSKDMTGKSGNLQVNFATKTQDGYNTLIDFSNKTAGWHTIALSATQQSWIVQPDFNWAQVNDLRITWFNRENAVDDLTICVDNIRLYKTVEDSVIEPALNQINNIGTVTAENYKEKLADIEAAEQGVSNLIDTYGQDVLTQLQNKDSLDAARAAYEEFAANQSDTPIPPEPDTPSDIPETPTDIPTDIPYGDVNGDEKVDAKDALEVLKFAVGKTKLTEDQQKAAEVDGKEGINAKDALEILKYAVKKINKFPIEK